jgi:hypothetical protein
MTFIDELPVADIQIGRADEMNIRIYGFDDIEPRLVEIRSGMLDRRLRLTCEQATVIAEGLLKAVAKARGDGG